MTYTIHSWYRDNPLMSEYFTVTASSKEAAKAIYHNIRSELYIIKSVSTP